MRHIHILDTSLASDNLGDEIIVSEARQYVSANFPDAYISSSSSHDGLGYYGRKLAGDADLILLLGTNALSAKYQRRGHFIWSVGRRDFKALEGKVVFVGVGASTNNRDVHPRQARLLKRLLSPNHKQSVRDETGKEILDSIGISAINTSCPTLWRYSSETPHIPTKSAPSVCFMLTQHKASENDLELVQSLRKCYKNLYFWPQQLRDLAYLRQLTDISDIKIVPPQLEAYDNLLANTDVDVVGTRLHGSIRGLLHKRRSLAIVIDNRARDIGRETGLPTHSRDELGAELVQKLNEGFSTRLSLPVNNIDLFLAQFRAGSLHNP
jgi:polysaccharide pyruvyl transferase WcaK-like protein